MQIILLVIYKAYHFIAFSFFCQINKYKYFCLATKNQYIVHAIIKLFVFWECNRVLVLVFTSTKTWFCTTSQTFQHFLYTHIIHNSNVYNIGIGIANNLKGKRMKCALRDVRQASNAVKRSLLLYISLRKSSLIYVFKRKSSLIYVFKRRRNFKIHPIFSSFTWDQSKQWPNSDDNNTLEKNDHWWKVTLGAIIVRQIIVKSLIKSKQMFEFAIWETFESDNKSQIWFTRYLVSNLLIFLRNKRCAFVIIKPFVKSLTRNASLTLKNPKPHN